MDTLTVVLLGVYLVVILWSSVFDSNVVLVLLSILIVPLAALAFTILSMLSCLSLSFDWWVLDLKDSVVVLSMALPCL